MVDPRITRSRTAVVATAEQHFVRHGYEATNLDVVAADAGVSKRTIYNVFGDKERLFREVLADLFDTVERFTTESVRALGDTDDVAAELTAVAVRQARTVLTERVVRLRRLLIGEAHRFPELAGEYYDRVPGQVVSTLADAMRRYADRGVLTVDDPVRAAEHFAFLVLGAPLDRALFTGKVPSRAKIDATAKAGVDAFLRAYS